MLTIEQKMTIVNMLSKKYNAYYDLVHQLSKKMYDAACEYRTAFAKLKKYGTAEAFYNAHKSVNGSICNRHYVTTDVGCSDDVVYRQYVRVSLNSNDPNSDYGYGQCVGWTFDSGNLRYYVPTQEWLCVQIGRVGSTEYNTIEKMVMRYADTSPQTIVRVNKWLDLEFRDGLVNLVERFINACSAGYAESLNAAEEKEAQLDNILLAEFGLSNKAKKHKAKSWKIEMKEVKL